MAITCNWKDKVGTLKHEDKTLTLYGGGNVYACICTDEKQGDAVYHNLVDFIVDKDHLKNILADPQNHYNRYSEIRLNVYYKETIQIAKILANAGIEVTLYKEVCKQ